MHKLGVAHLSALDLTPPELIRAAADIGYSNVGLRLIRVNEQSPGYPLMDNPPMLRETISACRETGVFVNDIEFLRIFPETQVNDYLSFLDAGASLGARHVIFAPYDENMARFAEKLADFDIACQERGLHPCLEFFPWTPVNDLTSCWEVIQRSRSGFGILVDTLHFDRSHSSLELLKSIPAERFGFTQICDAPVKSSYTEEELLLAARAERLAPGKGEIDIRGILHALPKDTPISLEIPQLSKAAAIGSRQVIEDLFNDTQQFLNQL